MPGQSVKHTSPTEASAGAELPDVRPTCERFSGGRGSPECGKPAEWAIVLCCSVKLVCGACLSIVNDKWSKEAQRCRTCGITYTPGRKAIKREIPL